MDGRLVTDCDPRTFSPNEVWLEFGDGRYLFKLKLKQLAELQEKCGEGIGALYIRVEMAKYHVLDLVEVIRLGLIGGGRGVVNEAEIAVTPEMARKLTETYCDRPLEDLWEIARAVYRACMVGYSNPDTKPGKEEAAATSAKAGSTSPRPSQTAPLSAE